MAHRRRLEALLLCFLLGASAGWLRPDAASAAPVLPDFTSATFLPGDPVDNPYFPLLDPRTRVFTGEDERFELTVEGPGPVILGVQTTIQRDRSFEEGLLVEDTFDFFAQDDDGNVWYLGEDVTNYLYDAQGNFLGTTNESQWRAGVNGALPGLIMPADLTVGFNYYQEFAPNDDALDQGTTDAVGLFLSLDFGDFDGVLRVFETTELEPDERGFKYYAPGIGLILEEEELDEDLEDPQQVFEITSIPEPTTGALLALGLAALARGFSRRASPLRAWTSDRLDPRRLRLDEDVHLLTDEGAQRVGLDGGRSPRATRRTGADRRARRSPRSAATCSTCC